MAEKFQDRNGADHIKQSVHNRQIKKFRASVEKTDYREQQHRYGSSGIAGEQPIEHGRAGYGARQRERDRDQDGNDGGREHYCVPSSNRVRRSISLPASPSAPARVRA